LEKVTQAKNDRSEVSTSAHSKEEEPETARQQASRTNNVINESTGAPIRNDGCPVSSQEEVSVRGSKRQRIFNYSREEGSQIKGSG